MPRLHEALETADWIHLDWDTSAMNQNGFVASRMPRIPEAFCRDGMGQLRVRTQTREDATMLYLDQMIYPPGVPITCSSMQDSSSQARIAAIEDRSNLPTLQLPDSMIDEDISLQPMGNSGGMNYYESRARVDGDVTLQRLFDVFVEQVEAQGWQADTRNMSSDIAVGFWRNAAESDQELIGVMTIIRMDEELYDLQFRQMTKAARSGVIGSRIFVR